MHQSLHHLVADAPWNDEEMLAEVRRYVLLAAAGEGATLAGRREPHRECSMAVSGDTLAWCREQAFRPSGGDFQGIGVYRSDGCFGERRGTDLRAPVIVSMSPPGYPSAMDCGRDDHR